MRPKITVVGSSSVGATTAQRIAERGYADVVMLDSADRVADANALDLNEAGALLAYEPKVVGTSDYADIAGSDIVVITSARTEMSHDAAMSENAEFVRTVSEEVKDRSPNSIVITMTAADALMCHLVAAITEFPRGRVTGVTGTVESARFRSLVASELGVSARDVAGLVLGGAGELAVPLLDCAAVAGMPARRLLSAERLDEIARRMRAAQNPAAAAVYGRSAAAVELVDAIALDQKRVLACTALCRGEYGLDGACVAVPVRLGCEGIEEILELELEERERSGIEAVARHVKQSLDALASR